MPLIKIRRRRGPLEARAAVVACMLLAANLASGEGEEGKGQPAYLVGFAQDTLANDWRLAQLRDVERELAKNPRIRFIYTDAGGKTSKQIFDIENLIDQQVDLLITSPRDSLALTPVLSRAYRQGIPVVLLSRRIAGPDYTLFIAPDNRKIGRLAARTLAEKLKGEGRILILQGIPTASTTVERTQSFLQEIAKYKKIEIAAIEPADYLRANAIRAVEESLLSNLRFDAIYAQSDSMATGARIALRQAGMDLHRIPIVGIDYIREAREAIRKGEQYASFTYPTAGREGARYVVKILWGEAVPKEVSLETQKVTLENVEEIEPIF